MISIQFLESRNNNRAINNLNRESFFSERSISQREEAQAEKSFFSCHRNGIPIGSNSTVLQPCESKENTQQ